MASKNLSVKIRAPFSLLGWQDHLKLLFFSSLRMEKEAENEACKREIARFSFCLTYNSPKYLE